jgi:putative alpha-1,2-mannosidase
MAPHVPERLIEVLGGAGVVEPRLVEFFEEAAIDAADDIEGLPETWYWHGNEVDLHAAWLFGWLDRPDLTQQWVDWIWGRWYGTGPDGLAGNDDGGTLSAWAAWAAMGLYPLAGTDRYALGAPQFPALDVAFGAGHTLHIERIGAGTVTRVELDGVVVDTPDLRHADLLDAHTLTFVAEGP